MTTQTGIHAGASARELHATEPPIGEVEWLDALPRLWTRVVAGMVACVGTELAGGMLLGPRIPWDNGYGAWIACAPIAVLAGMLVFRRPAWSARWRQGRRLRNALQQFEREVDEYVAPTQGAIRDHADGASAAREGARDANAEHPTDADSARGPSPSLPDGRSLARRIEWRQQVLRVDAAMERIPLEPDGAGTEYSRLLRKLEERGITNALDAFLATSVNGEPLFTTENLLYEIPRNIIITGLAGGMEAQGWRGTPITVQTDAPSVAMRSIPELNRLAGWATEVRASVEESHAPAKRSAPDGTAPDIDQLRAELGRLDQEIANRRARATKLSANALEAVRANFRADVREWLGAARTGAAT